MVLEATSLLAALNEVGRKGWVVYEVIHPNQPHSARSPMSEADLDDFNERTVGDLGWLSWADQVIAPYAVA